MTNPNEPIYPTMTLDLVEGTPQTVPDTYGLTKRETIAIQLAAGMWSNPALFEQLRAERIPLNNFGLFISAEVVKGADRLIAALNEQQATDYDNYFGEEENEDDKPSYYPEENK